MQEEAAIVAALVEEATKRSALVWLRYGTPPRTRPAWHAWTAGAAYVVSGGAEQDLSGLAEAAEAEVIVRSKEQGTHLVTWVAEPSLLDHRSPEWAEAVAVLRVERLNAPHAALLPLHWAADCDVIRLRPTGLLTAGPGLYPQDAQTQPPVPTPATTDPPVPWVAHRRPTRAPRL